jgi:hypothetical protein
MSTVRKCPLSENVRCQKMSAEYEIKLYSHPYYVTTQVLTLTREQLAGIVLLTLALTYGPVGPPLTIERLSDHQDMLDLNYYRQYIIGTGPSISVQQLNQQYQQFIHSGVHTPSEFVDQLNFTQPSQPGRLPGHYQASHNYIIFPYWCVFTGNYETSIVQFNTPRFLQGALSACQWLRTNWHNHITLIHHRNELEEIGGFASS